MLINFNNVNGLPMAVLFEGNASICVEKCLEPLGGTCLMFTNETTETILYVSENPLKTMRMYLRIVQAYADGYKLFNLLDLDYDEET